MGRSGWQAWSTITEQMGCASSCSAWASCFPFLFMVHLFYWRSANNHHHHNS